MKKFLSLILALAMMLGLVVNANTAAKAVTAETTVMINCTTDQPVDTTEEAKVSEWFAGYMTRVRAYCNKRPIALLRARRKKAKKILRRFLWILAASFVRDHTVTVRKIAKIVALMPLMFLLGTTATAAKTEELTEPEKPAIRESRKLTTKLPKLGLNVYQYEEDDIFSSEFMYEIRNCVRQYEKFLDSCKEARNDPSKKKNWVAFNASRQALENAKKLISAGKVFKPVTGRGRSTRLSRTNVFDAVGVNYDDRQPVSEFAVVKHGINEICDLPLKVFDKDEEKAKMLREQFMKSIYNVLIKEGLWINGINFIALASSASHQKQMKVLLIRKDVAEEHQELFWFGKTKRAFLSGKRISGAAYWKIRANMIRPISAPFQTADGQVVNHRDILVIKDFVIRMKSENTRTVGCFEKDGKKSFWKEGSAEFERTFCDGGILFLVPMMNQGQCTCLGLKGLGVDATSAIDYICRKYGLTLEEFMNIEVKDADGIWRRIGDYKAICGEGCLKFDKCFDTVEQYHIWLDQMEERYPGIGTAYILRQAEENEDEYRPRSMAKTMLQQFIDIGWKDSYQLVRRTARHLNKMRTFTGAVAKLSGEGKDPEDLDFDQKVIRDIPEMVLIPNVLKALHKAWNKVLTRAFAGKILTQGQYPYIMEDLVAVLEVWLGFKDVNDQDIGILRGDQISAADLEDGKEVVFLRYPANFQTALTMTNVVHEAFASVNNICIVSVHSLVLTIQDGDVDGDEAGLWYNQILVRLVKEMREEYKPPVILFEHDETKSDKEPYSDLNGFNEEIAAALWRAKEFDTVGKDAIAANACAYLAAYARSMGDMEAMDQYLLWMSIFSTGAIMSIDQVKGKTIDVALVNRLDSIREEVLDQLQHIATAAGVDPELAMKIKYPRAHYWSALAKNSPVTEGSCLPRSTDCVMGKMEAWLRSLAAYNMDIDKADEFIERFDAEGNSCNVQEVVARLTSGLAPHTIHTVKLPEEARTMFGENWVNRMKTGEGNEVGKKVVDAIRNGQPVGMAELLTALCQNMNAIYMLCPGRELKDKEREYYAVCRHIMFGLIESDKEVFVKDGHTYTKRDNQRVMADIAIIRALTKDTGYDYQFVLNVFEPEIKENMARNKDRKSEELYARIIENYSSEKEYFESMPEVPADIGFKPTKLKHVNFSTSVPAEEPTDAEQAEAATVSFDISEDEKAYKEMLEMGLLD